MIKCAPFFYNYLMKQLVLKSDPQESESNLISKET